MGILEVFSIYDMSATSNVLRPYLSRYTLIWEPLCDGRCVSYREVRRTRHDR